jgi:hypothetical protein
MRTSLPWVAWRARFSAPRMPPVTKWNSVPPFIASVGRGWCVGPYTGTT